jgi:hypothetical protein
MCMCMSLCSLHVVYSVMIGAITFDQMLFTLIENFVNFNWRIKGHSETVFKVFINYRGRHLKVSQFIMPLKLV